MKKVIYLLIFAAFVYSCNSANKSEEVETVSVADFLASPEKWADKEVKIVGTVSHICKHSGKKMFVFGTDSESTVKIFAGGEVSTFDIDLEGSEVEVIGKVIEEARIDEQYLAEWEEEIKQSVGDSAQKVCAADGAAVSAQTNQTDTVATEETVEDDPYAMIKEYRKKLTDSGQAYIPVYAIECIKVKEIAN